MESSSVCRESAFQSALPIWPEGKEKDKNLLVGFRAIFAIPSSGRVRLCAAASTLYRVFLNGEFLAHGPARGPHGFYRIDEWDLSGRLRVGENLLAFEVAGYNVNSYYLLDQPSFLQAEVVCEGQILASTAGQGNRFEALALPERVRKVQRYSFQRPFIEAYRLTPGFDAWRKNDATPIAAEPCAIQGDKALIPRRVAAPRFSRKPFICELSKGTVRTGCAVEKPWKDRALTQIGPNLGGFPEDELETIPSLELQTVANDSVEPVNESLERDHVLSMESNSFRILDLGANSTGFIGATVQCAKESRLFFTFDEILLDEDVDFSRMQCVNVLAVEAPPGLYRIESFEPYTLRYLKLIVLEGECEVSDLYLREYVNPEVWEAQFSASDTRLNRLFEAGRSTFAQNAVDVFMDCPSRERAGWLCDSYFTARVARDFSGHTIIEKMMFENYLLPEKFPHLPDGMLPMCYPSDHNGGNFIPNWAMWFVVELEEYLARSGDKNLVEALRQKILALFAYFQRFKNEDGLLEKLERWVFVEWSEANNLVQDVNYPSNMLFAGALGAAGRMYGIPEMLDESEAIHETIRRQSFDGEFFVDNAVRKDGKLELSGERTEVCQYYAFTFETATARTHAELWDKLVHHFGPGRKASGAFPEIHPANAFIGNYLRLDLLSRRGLCQQILDESVDYFLYMAERTGTLWEHDSTKGSCNHGFASHAVHSLYRDVLGLLELDTEDRIVRLRFTELALEWCEGRVPIGKDFVALRWWKEGDTVYYRVEAPAGYGIEVENLTGKNLVRRP